MRNKFFDKIDSIRINNRICSIISIIVLALNMIPLGIMAFFAHPICDDFWYCINQHQAYIADMSLKAQLSAYIETFRFFFNNQQGSFGTIIFCSLMPATYIRKLYFIGPLFMFGILLTGIFFLFRTISKTLFHNYETGTIIASCISLIVVNLSPSLLEQFYWWNGAANYTVFSGFMLICYALITRFYYDEEFEFSDKQAKKTIATVIACVISVLSSGANYVPALLHVEITILLFFMLSVRRRKISYNAALVLLFTLVGFVISLTAPGNQVRISGTQHFGDYSIPRAIIRSIYYADHTILGDMRPFIFFILVLLIPFIWEQIDSKIKWSWRECLFCEVITFLLYASSFAPTVYAEGYDGPDRCIAFRFVYLVIFYFLNEISIVAVVKVLFNDNIVKTDRNSSCNQKVHFCFIICVLEIVVVFSAYCVPKENRTKFGSTAALRSILIGEAAEYDRIMDEREILLSSETGDLTIVKPNVAPVMLYNGSMDISADASENRNMDMAAYYGVNTVTLKYNNNE